MQRARRLCVGSIVKLRYLQVLVEEKKNINNTITGYYVSGFLFESKRAAIFLTSIFPSAGSSRTAGPALGKGGGADGFAGFIGFPGF